MPSVTPGQKALSEVLLSYVDNDPRLFRCPVDEKYFPTEGLSYEYPPARRGPSGQTLDELRAAWPSTPIELIWVSYDFAPVHAPSGKIGDRVYLYADGHCQ
jgi:hypothetical protein